MATTSDERAERGHGEPAPLALEVGVGGDQEQRRQPHRAEGLGRHHLEQHQQGEVHGGDQGLSTNSGRRRASTSTATVQGSASPPITSAVLGVVRQPQSHDRDQRDQRRRYARGGEHLHRARGLDRQPAEHQTAVRRRRPSRSRHAATPAPAESISQSTGVPWRPSTKDWWSSSVAA